jgi:hypothetical protein
MSTYNNIFGGNFVQPSSVSYQNLTLTSNVTLSWPTSYLDNSSDLVLAENMTVQAASQSAIITSLANNPLTTTSGSGTVSVAVDSTSNLYVGTPITVSAATTFNGITALQLNITALITGFVGGNSFTYSSGGTANASGAGGGNAVMLSYAVPYAIMLPDATQVSTGQTVRFINTGMNPFLVTDNAQNLLITLNSGNVYDLLLINNTTSAGEWEILQAGTGTASSNASALAGLGLTTLNGVLNTDFQSKAINGNYSAVLSDRGSMLVWAGGTGTITLPPVNNPAPKGYSVSVNNSGSGTVTLVTSDSTTIDGATTFPLNPGESCEFILTSPNWNTLGFGVETFFAVNTLSLDISGAAINNLTNSQSSRIVQTYTGALSQNTIVTFPAGPGQWYVWNNTTNNFTLTLQLFGAGGGFIVPQGEKLVVYSDGNNIYFTPTTATNAVFNPGNVGSPTIVFNNDPTTGFFSDGVGDFGFSASGTLSLDLASYGLGIRAGGQTQYYNSNNTYYASFEAGNMTSNVNWTLPLLDATSSGQILFSNGGGTLAFTNVSYPISTTANQLLYSSATNTITGLATANSGVLVTSAGGIPSIGSTLPTAVQSNITQLGTISSITAPLGVPFGGTGLTTLTTANGVICAGVTATGVLQTTGTGTTNQVLMSNGTALPRFKNVTIALPAAGKSDQISGTSTTVYVNPAVQQYHPSAASAWVNFVGTGTTGSNCTMLASYNTSSVFKNGTGDYLVTFTFSFSTASYCSIISGARGALISSAGMLGYTTTNLTSSTCRILTRDAANNPVDFALVDGLFFGTQ